MLRFSDDFKGWVLVARTYLRQVLTDQHIAVLYPLLETVLRFHVDAQLDTETPIVEATFKAIRMAFEAVQPLLRLVLSVVEGY